VAQKKQLVVKEENYQLIAENMYKLGAYDILRRCILEHEITMVLSKSHEGVARGQSEGKETTHKIMRAGLWWPTLHKYAKYFF
jgi:hypothetical protein